MVRHRPAPPETPPRGLKSCLPRALAFAAALLAALPAGAEAPHEAAGVRPTAIPLLNFSSDDGVGYGLRANLYEYDGRTVPYLRKYSAQLFFTSGGRRVHHLSMDTPRFRGGDDRLELVLRFEKESFANFHGSLTDGEARGLGREQKTFQHDLPSMELRWIRRLGPAGPSPAPWGLGTGARLSHAGITPNAGAEAGNVLAEAAPPGVDGGILGQVNAFLRYDTRDDYNDTSTGMLEEFLVEYGIGSGGDYKGLTVRFEHRHFAAPVAGLVAAHRLALDWTAGDLPFYEWPEVGGGDTLRGLVRGRDRGRGRVLANGELRWRGMRLSARENMHLGAVAFADAGRILGGGAAAAPGRWRRGLGMGRRARRLGPGGRRRGPLPHLRAHVLTAGPLSLSVRRHARATRQAARTRRRPSGLCWPSGGPAPGRCPPFP